MFKVHMPRIISFDAPTDEELKENPLKVLWNSLLSLDKFTKSFLIITLLIILSAPFFIFNRQTLKQNAESNNQVSIAKIDTTGKFADGEILLRFKAGAPKGLQDSILTNHNAETVKDISQIRVKEIRVPSEALDEVIKALSHNPAVEFAERNSLVAAQDTIPNDPWWLNEWGPVKINAPKAWDISTGSQYTIIAILDSGVDFTQPDLQGKFVQGYDFVNNDSDPTDDHGHGTYVSGVASAVTNNATGVASYCWNCSIQPVKVLDSSGSGTYSNVASGIIWAADHGAKIINMSLGGTSTSSTLQSAVQYAYSKDVVLVAAAGNYGNTTPIYPAAFKEVLGVAGTDGVDKLYSWSSFGSWVKLAAPGCNLTTGRLNWYGTFCGTSSSSPALAGVVGLLRSLNPLATNTQVEQSLETGAVNIGSVVVYGRVDAYKAFQVLSGIGGGSTSTPTPTPILPSTSDTMPPTVSITFPLSGSIISKLSTITIYSNASDNIGISKVETYINGGLICTTTLVSANGQYGCAWKVPGKKNASYVVTSKAYDVSGNNSLSASVKVTAQ